MANYYATARSNYFAVKDETAFREWADHLGLTILEMACCSRRTMAVPSLPPTDGSCER